MAARGGFREPVPRRFKVSFDIMPAGMQRAEREHRARMSCRHRAQEPGFCQLMIAHDASAVHMARAERHLRFGHTGRGGAGKPEGGLSIVLRHTATFGEHPGVPILCVHHVFGRASQPEDGALIVAWHADPLSEADRVVERADWVALIGRALKPFMHRRRLTSESRMHRRPAAMRRD